MYKRLLFPAFTIFLFACSADTKSPKGGNLSPHFNLEQLANEQGSLLTKANPTVEKWVEINGKTEKSTLPISNWENELGVFRKSNIDKPAYVGEYSVKDTPMDNGHTVRTYAALKDNLSVKYQQIEFDQKGNPTKIASSSVDKNFLYFTKKEVVAEFEAVGGKNRLKNYGVNILQKIICLDTFKMKVEARIK